MKFIRKVLLGCAAFCMAIASAQAGQVARKKLIQYGWDYRDQAFIREHVREMEEKPFDGIIFRLKGRSSIFRDQPWDEKSFEQIVEECKAIEWSKFTDNFIIIHSSTSMDWFKDDDWKGAIHNLRLVLKAATAARCRGICIDPEPYGPSPWSYWTQQHAESKSFEEYQAIARKRGADFIRVIQQEMPEAVLLSLYQFCLFEGPAGEINPERRDGMLAKHPYGIYHSFLTGMLDAAAPGISFVDGNEFSYYYKEPLDFYVAYHKIKQLCQNLAGKENRVKYQSQVKVGQALYPDYLLALGTWGDKRFTPAQELSEADRLRWLEHNVYYGLKSADEFVWMYNEKMNWWEGDDIPEGMEEAIRRAKARMAKGVDLDFEIGDMIKAAEKRGKEKTRANLMTRTATISRVKPTAEGLKVDGDLDKPFWSGVKPLSPLIPTFSRGTPLKGETEVKVAYDDEHLYVAFRCLEPKVKEMRAVKDPIWLGDSIDLYLSRSESRDAYLHLIVNPENVQWTRGAEEGQNSAPLRFESATKVGEGHWSVEMAIPWKAMETTAPASGEKRFANLCRFRVPDQEISAWSQVLQEFNEPKSFGTWIFQ
ncbi:MAG TPA: carbohydrate-binding family 9-like protein [Chthoniobacteraceae bacterium]|nr:carbohydrate-binding family 9-like protein [Chthoniobacteraceae bacterium]